MGHSGQWRFAWITGASLIYEATPRILAASSSTETIEEAEHPAAGGLVPADPPAYEPFPYVSVPGSPTSPFPHISSLDSLPPPSFHISSVGSFSSVPSPCLFSAATDVSCVLGTSILIETVEEETLMCFTSQEFR